MNLETFLSKGLDQRLVCVCIHFYMIQNIYNINIQNYIVYKICNTHYMLYNKYNIK